MAKYIPKVVPEPIWKNEVSSTKTELGEALTWYSSERNTKDARKYFIEYLKSKLTPSQKIAAGMLGDSYFSTAGFTARMLSRGCVLPETSKHWLDNQISEFLEKINNIVKEKNLDDSVTTAVPKNVISIQERVQDKVDYFIMELEGKFDEIWHRSSKEDFIPYTWMIDNEIKPMHASKIAEYFKQRCSDWIAVIESKDEYVKESYPRSKKEMIEAAKFFGLIASDAEKLASNKNAAKKPRKKKTIPMEKRVAKLNYKKDDIDNKLVSINPVKIMGSQQLWIYNVKTRKLGVYVAIDAAGLSVKGSAIDNYKYSESITKTLRKPNEVLKKVLEGGKIVLRKVMSDVNSKPSELNGRINKDTILLRVE